MLYVLVERLHVLLNNDLLYGPPNELRRQHYIFRL